MKFYGVFIVIFVLKILHLESKSIYLAVHIIYIHGRYAQDYFAVILDKMPAGKFSKLI